MKAQIKAGQVVRIHNTEIDPSNRAKPQTAYVVAVEEGYAWLRINGRHECERPVWMLTVVR